MKLKLFSQLGFIALLTLCLSSHAFAQTEIAWGDFSNIVNPNGGSGGPFSIDNSAGGGSLTFTANLTRWDTNNSNVNDFSAGETSDSQFTWDDSVRSLIGFGDTAYTATFDNISSNDGSLYLGAGALENDNILTIAAFDSNGSAVSLADTTLIGQWNGPGSGGTPQWNSTLGTLSTPGGGASGANALVDLSNLGINRIELNYTDAAGGTVRAGDRWHVDIASNAAASSIPEPSSLLLLCSIAGVMSISRRRFA